MSDLVERLRNPNYAKSQTFAESYMREAAAEIERIRNGIQDYLDGDYGRSQHFKTKHDKCPHGLFSWESCENCIEAYFVKLLSPAHHEAPEKTGASQS